MAELRQFQREIYRDRGFPHAAFAAGDGDEIPHARNRLAFRLLHGCWTWWHLLPLSWDRHSCLSSVPSSTIHFAHIFGKRSAGGNFRRTQAPWHLLYFFPEPQGQGSLRPTFAPTLTGFGASACAGPVWYCRSRCWRCCLRSISRANPGRCGGSLARAAALATAAAALGG